jgi:hypothetical protein
MRRSQKVPERPADKRGRDMPLGGQLIHNTLLFYLLHEKSLITACQPTNIPPKDLLRDFFLAR